MLYEIANICVAPAIATSTAEKVYTGCRLKPTAFSPLFWRTWRSHGVETSPPLRQLAKKGGPLFEASPRYQMRPNLERGPELASR
jgi:hypothetical protein